MNEPGFKVHQAIHGYSQGHQLLTASVQLRSRDAKTMLILSDISGQAAQIDSPGYLTGYPLPDSKFYVFARTWPAPEMPRPGCVWTHSLLMDFADLAILSDATGLLQLFRRPESNALSEYAQQLEVPQISGIGQLRENAVDLAHHLIGALYSRPHDRVVAPLQNSIDVDQITIALWAQQWPRLRRSFRFCTLSLTDRSGDYGAFDLQFYRTQEGSSRSRFPKSVDAYDVPSEVDDWIDNAIADLMHPDVIGLRSFMRQIGADIDAGRDAFKLICQFHTALYGSSSRSASIERAITLYDHEFSAFQARTARALLIKEVLRQPILSDSELDFITRSLPSLDMSILSGGHRTLGEQIWRKDPACIAAMIKASNQERQIAEATLAKLPTDYLLEGIARVPDIAALALAHRPDLLEHAEFWTTDGVSAEAALTALSERSSLTSIISALMQAARPDLISQTLQAVGAAVVLRALAELWRGFAKEKSGTLISWLRAAAQNTAAVADALAHIAIPEDMLSALAHIVEPDEIPNDYGTDPWLLAANRSREAHSGSLATYLSAFLVSRALGWRSRNQAELVQLGFDPVYTALEDSVLGEDAWRLVDAKLPWSLPWLSWDRCLRLRNAIIDLFVDRDLSAGIFAKVTDDERRFGEIVASLSKTYRGRRYIGYLRQELSRDASSRSKERNHIIDEVTGIS